MYMAMMCIGMVGMLCYVLSRRKKVNLSVLQSVLLTSFLIAVGLIGSFVLGYVSWGQIGSKDFCGAIFLIIPVIPFIGKLFGLKSAQIYDLAALCMPIVHFFVRIGCMLNGCCEGIVIYVGNRYFQFPYIITMSLLNILIILWLLRIESGGKKQGDLYPLFLLAFGLMRVICDSFMYFENLMLGMRPAQWYGLLAAAIGCIWLIIHKKRETDWLNQSKVFKS